MTDSNSVILQAMTIDSFCNYVNSSNCDKAIFTKKGENKEKFTRDFKDWVYKRKSYLSELAFKDQKRYNQMPKISEFMPEDDWLELLAIWKLNMVNVNQIKQSGRADWRDKSTKF